MPPRIAIPMPHSTDHEYAERAIPQYERAVVIAGGEPVRIPLDHTPDELRSMIEQCDGVLLPGSNADVDPKRFQQEKSLHTATADLRREEVDDLLLEHAYAHRKPVLGICYGLQSLNVFRKGSLVQHIPQFLPETTCAKVNHEAGKNVAVAHTVSIEAESKLAQIVRGWDGTGKASFFGSKGDEPQRTRSYTKGDVSGKNRGLSGDTLTVPVNSSHHQSADIIGDGLRLVARCPDDGIIEALEGTASDHFVLAVQWHPERSVDDDEHSKRIFRALVEAAR
jgi:putative glutamine amidotransferase